MKSSSKLFALALTLLSLTMVTASMPFASPFKKCTSNNGQATGVRVSACTKFPCILKKGGSVSIEVDFIPSIGATTLTDRVHGIIAGIGVPFSTGNPDGCQGKGLPCPLMAGQRYTFKTDIPILTLYPSLRLIVEWALIDQHGIAVFCVQIPAQINSLL